MKTNNSNRTILEQKMLTKCIFQGFTIKQTAKAMNYSKSTISNKMNKLFQKYQAKTRIEFIVSVFGEISDKNKKEIEGLSAQTQALRNKIKALSSVLSKIILNEHNKIQLKYLLEEAKKLLI